MKKPLQNARAVSKIVGVIFLYFCGTFYQDRRFIV